VTPAATTLPLTDLLFGLIFALVLNQKVLEEEEKKGRAR
jgi:hypothetical protein